MTELPSFNPNQVIMEAIGEITRSINTFVNFFASINRLFCHLRWFERNIRNSSSQLLIIVGGIVLLCFFIFYSATDTGRSTLESFGFSKESADTVKVYAPMIFILGIIVLFLMKRWNEGPQQSEGGFDEVMFGGNERGDIEQNRRGVVTPFYVGNKMPALNSRLYH